MSIYDIQDLEEISSSGKIQGYLKVETTDIKLPFTLIKGENEGKRILLTAGIHGAEYVGIETSKKLAKCIEASQVSGEILIIHKVNVSGFRKKLAGVTAEDHLNLNRIFPGKKDGNTSERLAYFILNSLSKKADFYVDMHGADLHGRIKPIVFFPIAVDTELARLTRDVALASGFPYLVESTAKKGSYSRAAQEGVPSILTEFGGSGLWSFEEVSYYSDKILNILDFLEVIKREKKKNIEPTFFYPVEEIMAENSGFWYPNFAVGDLVKSGESLGKVTDVFDNVLEEHFAKDEGMIMYQTVALSVEEAGLLTAISKKKE